MKIVHNTIWGMRELAILRIASQMHVVKLLEGYQHHNGNFVLFLEYVNAPEVFLPSSDKELEQYAAQLVEVSNQHSTN